MEKVFGNTAISLGSNGKPFTSPVGEVHLDWNTSHHGKYLALVAVKSNSHVHLGVDVAKVNQHTASPNAVSFLNDMRDCNSTRELEYIRQTGLTGFWYIWCIKESWFKALGIGLQSSLLQHFDFEIPPLQTANCHSADCPIIVKWRDTEETYKYCPEPIEWVIELGHLDEEHCYGITSSECVQWTPWITINSLMESL